MVRIGRARKSSMPPDVLYHQYGQALLDSVRDGSYPESEEVISAELPPAAIPDILNNLEQTRNDVKANIQIISKDSAPDIDGWISQAKQLRQDIELAHDTSSNIINETVDSLNLQGQVRDAANKVALLDGELAFTKTLISFFERIDKLRKVLASIERSILNDQIVELTDTLVQASTELDDIRAQHDTCVAEVLKARLNSLREEVERSLLFHWNTLLRVEVSSSSVSAQQAIQRNAVITLDAVSKALSTLGLLGNAISTFCTNLEKAILLPRLQWHPDESTRSIILDRDLLRVSESSTEPILQNLFDDISKVIRFLGEHLPRSILRDASKILMPNLLSRLKSVWLSSAVPIDLEATETLQSIIQSVIDFSNLLEKQEWPGKADLMDWVEDIPRFWLGKRRQQSLDRVKSLLAGRPRTARTVERVETQFVSPKEGIFTNAEAANEWNAEWSDDEGSVRPNPGNVGLNHSKNTEKDEDVVAWGLDEFNEGEAQPQEPELRGDCEEDAWGWGEEEEASGERSHATKKAVSNPSKQESNGSFGTAPRTAMEITLKETYNITSLPIELLAIIRDIIIDVELIQSKNSQSPIASAAIGLLDLPSLVLTMYRAGASISYSLNPSGNMFLYNDSLWLAERLQELSEKHAKARLQLTADIQALSTLSKRAYGKEMESQRTILSDMLDGAQGLVQCTEPPFAQECDLAITSAVERVRDLHVQWEPILSHSALLQSLGSLLSTLITKMIVDVEDMSDISEPESQQLAIFCSRVASLENLFLPHMRSRERVEAVASLTAVYTPGWLKFQYLTNILESSLADIKFLWEEGELSLEFDVNEVVELVEALFADTEHRRRAIGEMRRLSGNR